MSAKKKLRCAAVYRLEGLTAILLSKYDYAHHHGDGVEFHSKGGSDQLYGGTETDFGQNIGFAIAQDPSFSANSARGVLGGFKVVQSGQHQLVYGCDADKIYYTVIVGRDYPSRVAITGLGVLYTSFSKQFGRSVTLSAVEGALTKSGHKTIKAFCKEYEMPENTDAANKVLGQVAGVKNQMQDNISNMLKNSEDAGALKGKTETLNAEAGKYKKRAKKVKKHMWLKNMKTTFVLAMVVIIILLLVLVPLILKLQHLKSEMSFNNVQN